MPAGPPLLQTVLVLDDWLGQKHEVKPLAEEEAVLGEEPAAVEEEAVPAPEAGEAPGLPWRCAWIE